MANIYRCRLSEYLDFDIKADYDEQVLEWLSTHSIAEVLRLTSNADKSFSEAILHIEGNKSDADIDISVEARFKDVYLVTDIDWDVDDDDVDLPNTVDVRLADIIDNAPWLETDGMIEDAIKDEIVDYLTDKYGYCIFSCYIAKKEG